jgi:hypothetical protein
LTHRLGHAKRGARIALVLLAAAGCADLAALTALQRGLAQRFKEPAISIHISNHEYLTVLFVNSKVASLPDSARAVLAREVAEYVRDHYRGYASLSTVAVGFQQSLRVGMFSYRSTNRPYSFSTAGLGPPQDTLQAQRPP